MWNLLLSGTGAGFSPVTSASPCQHNSTIAPYSCAMGLSAVQFHRQTVISHRNTIKMAYRHSNSRDQVRSFWYMRCIIRFLITFVSTVYLWHISWTTVLLEKTDSKLVRNSLRCIELLRCITEHNDTPLTILETFLILSSHPRLGLPNVSSVDVIRQKKFVCISHLYHACCMPRLSTLIWSPK